MWICDGYVVEVCVNFGDIVGVVCVVELGVEGVGLLCIEFVFMNNVCVLDLVI